MTKKCICTVVVLLSLAALELWAQSDSLPYPPRKFFQELAKTRIPPGKAGCCQELRRMLEQSVMIPASLAVKLYRTGRILIGDARTEGEIRDSYISGAVLLPYDRLDFMKLKPLKIPIALY